MKKINMKRKGGRKLELPEGGYGFVIGNGTSRKDLDIKQLMDYGIFYACNWFFKEEFRPHVLVCSDEPITKTILKTYQQYPRTNWMYTWFPKPGSGAKKPSIPEKFAAGPMATAVAAEHHKCEKVFLIGMDFFGFGSEDKDKNGQLNNLYAGKKHYRKDEDGPAPTYRNWQRRYQWILQNYPDTEVWHVNPMGGKSPERLVGAPHWHQCTYENLIDHLENDVELVDIKEVTEEDEMLYLETNPDNIRASYERQLSGQENIIMEDPLSVQELIDLRSQSHQWYTKNGLEKGEIAIDIEGQPVMVPPMVVREGNINRLATEKEVIMILEQELKERYGIDQKLQIDGRDGNHTPPPPPPGMVPPPPPPAAMAPPPPPPPPPPLKAEG